MLRILIVVALTLPALADVQARGFRFSAHPRAVSLTARPAIRTTERSSLSSGPVLFGGGQEPAQPAAQRSVLDQPAPQAASAGAASMAPPPVVKPLDRAAHWCDHGVVVGSGAGFCVLEVSTADPS